MTNFLGQFSNGDGTYNGAAMLAALTGLSKAEVEWTAKRVQQLVRHDGKTSREAAEIVKIEAKTKPWERTS